MWNKKKIWNYWRNIISVPPGRHKFTAQFVIDVYTWFAVNNDVLVTSEVTRQWFSRVNQSWLKIKDESLHEWTQMVIYGKEHIISLLHALTNAY